MRTCLLSSLLLLLGESSGYSLWDAQKAARSLVSPNQSLFRPPMTMLQRDTIQMPSTTPMVPFKVIFG
jgi:hypothetical protein